MREIKLDELIREHERYGIMAHRNNDKDALRLINSVVDALQELKECRAVTDCEKSSYIDEKGIPTELAVLRRQYLEFKNENIQLKKELKERMECELRPATKFKYEPLEKQLKKIQEELLEAKTAFIKNDTVNLVEELGDVQAACVTALDMMHVGEKPRMNLRKFINKKNEERGYFDEPVANQNKFNQEADELSKAAAPLIELMQRKYNPHNKIIVTLDRIEVLSGEMGIPVEVHDDN